MCITVDDPEADALLRRTASPRIIVTSLWNRHRHGHHRRMLCSVGPPADAPGSADAARVAALAKVPRSFLVSIVTRARGAICDVSRNRAMQGRPPSLVSIVARVRDAMCDVSRTHAMNAARVRRAPQQSFGIIV